MSSKLNRREFLKLAGLMPLAASGTLSILDPIGNPLISRSAAPDQPNILFLVFDTLSARHMSLYGYPRQTTPYIDKFAERAIVFHNHYAGGNFTSPGTASLLTGNLPWSNRAFNLQGEVIEKFFTRNLFSTVPSGTYTNSYSHNDLALLLLSQFRTFIDKIQWPRPTALADLKYSDFLFPKDFNASYHGEMVNLIGNKRVTGSLFLSFLYRWFLQRTDDRLKAENKDEFPRGVPQLNEIFFKMEEGVDWSIAEIKNMPRPYLAYFHYLPPHEPYMPRKEFNNLFNDDFKPVEKPESFQTEGFTQRSLDANRKRYDRYIAFTDSEFGRMIDRLEQEGILDNTWIILTSDHGQLFERGIHGHTSSTLYDPVVHVPLVIRRPDSQSREDIFDLTSCIDVLPSIQTIYGQPIPEWCEGRILPTFDGYNPQEKWPVYAMVNRDCPKYGPIDSGTFMVMDGDYKLAHYMLEPQHDELFNLAKDPEELENLISTETEVADRMMALLNKKLEEYSLPKTA
jgi:arylsulfatase A-like enzyme